MPCTRVLRSIREDACNPVGAEDSMLKRDDWLDLARKLDWEFSYVSEEEVFPKAVSGTPWLPAREWSDWDEPYRTSYAEYVATQASKEATVYAAREAVGRAKQLEDADRGW